MFNFIKKWFGPKEEVLPELLPEWFGEHCDSYDIDGNHLGHRFFAPNPVNELTLLRAMSGYHEVSRGITQSYSGRSGEVRVWAKNPHEAQRVLNAVPDKITARGRQLVAVFSCINCQDSGCWECDW